MVRPIPNARDLLESMKNHMQVAIQAREKYYAGTAEAVSDYENQVEGSPYATATSAASAKYQFQTSYVGRDAVGDLKLFAFQAIMFGVADIASSLRSIARDVYMLRRLTEDEQNARLQNPTIPRPRSQG